MVKAHEVAVADHEKRRGVDRPDLVSGPAGEVVNDRLHALEEWEEVRRVRRHRLVAGLPAGELLRGRQPRIILLRRRDLGVVAVGADVRGSEHEAADLGRVAESKARGGEGTQTEAPDVDGPAPGDPVDHLGDVVGEALDGHGAAGVGCVAVTLQLDADHSAALGEPGKDVAEAAAEGHDAAVEGNERRSCGVAVLLVPDRDAINFLVGHAFRR